MLPRADGVLRTRVPEAAIHEHRQLGPRKHEVGSDRARPCDLPFPGGGTRSHGRAQRELHLPAAARDAEVAELPDQCAFGAGVAP